MLLLPALRYIGAGPVFPASDPVGAPAETIWGAVGPGEELHQVPPAWCCAACLARCCHTQFSHFWKIVTTEWGYSDILLDINNSFLSSDNSILEEFRKTEEFQSWSAAIICKLSIVLGTISALSLNLPQFPFCRAYSVQVSKTYFHNLYSRWQSVQP